MDYEGMGCEAVGWIILAEHKFPANFCKQLKVSVSQWRHLRISTQVMSIYMPMFPCTDTLSFCLLHVKILDFIIFFCHWAPIFEPLQTAHQSGFIPTFISTSRTFSILYCLLWVTCNCSVVCSVVICVRIKFYYCLVYFLVPGYLICDAEWAIEYQCYNVCIGFLKWFGQ
jgi:hypothetical protein